IAGRTKHFINAFGEEVMVHNTDAAVAEACKQTGARVLNYTVAPVFTAARTKGRHQWLIEFHTLPSDIDDFANRLDAALCGVNSDYQAKRSGSIFLDRLSITVAREGLFDRWLGSTGKLGGQRKVPRLSNDRTIMDSMLKFQ
ncbi:MAG: GH3 auxin-responsive promoter family protein, partial [Prevotella sp.]|nr:GH3 auxin-responsive promoter family protein [Prevotella sp.]